MKKINKDHKVAAGNVAFMLTAEKIIELMNDDIISDLPESFEATKNKMFELKESFYKDLSVSMQDYVEDVDST